MRHRKSWARSSGVGALNACTWTPSGSIAPITWRMIPPLPAVSMPCRTTSRDGTSPTGASRTDWANSSSCRSASTAPRAARSFLPFALSPP